MSLVRYIANALFAAIVVLGVFMLAPAAAETDIFSEEDGAGSDAWVFAGLFGNDAEPVNAGSGASRQVTGEFRVVDYGDGTVDVRVSAVREDGDAVEKDVFGVPVIWKCLWLDGLLPAIECVHVVDANEGFFSTITMLEGGEGLFSVSFGDEGAGQYSLEGAIRDPLKIRCLRREYESMAPLPSDNGQVRLIGDGPPSWLKPFETCEGSIYTVYLKEMPRRRSVVA